MRKQYVAEAEVAGLGELVRDEGRYWAFVGLLLEAVAPTLLAVYDVFYRVRRGGVRDMADEEGINGALVRAKQLDGVVAQLVGTLQKSVSMGIAGIAVVRAYLARLGHESAEDHNPLLQKIAEVYPELRAGGKRALHVVGWLVRTNFAPKLLRRVVVANQEVDQADHHDAPSSKGSIVGDEQEDPRNLKSTMPVAEEPAAVGATSPVIIASRESVSVHPGPFCQIPEIGGLNSDGRTLPMMGLGTGTMAEQQFLDVCVAFLSGGGRLLDTAAMYDNFKLVHDCVRLSKVDRKNVIIISKVMPLGTTITREQVQRSVDKLKFRVYGARRGKGEKRYWGETRLSAEADQVGKVAAARQISEAVDEDGFPFHMPVIDYLLIHWPGNNPGQRLQDRLPAECVGERISGEKSERNEQIDVVDPLHDWRKCREDAYQVLLDFQKSGLVGKVGVSNFAFKHLHEFAVAFPGNPPQMHQMELNTAYVDRAVFEYHLSLNAQLRHSKQFDKVCAIVAYGALGGNPRSHLNLKHIQQIADRNDMSRLATILLWLTSYEVTVLVTTKNLAKLRENMCLWEQYDKEARERLTDVDKDFLMETAGNFFRKSYLPYPEEVH